MQMMTQIDVTKLRLGRSSLKMLKVRADTHTLTALDAERLIRRIEEAFEEFEPILDGGMELVDAPFQVIDGGRS